MTQTLLIIDTETTGINPTQDTVIEIGAILYSVSCQTALSHLSFLLYADQNAAEPINRIPPTALTALPHVLQHKSLSLLQELALAADYIVAHNAEFDSQWFNDQQLPILRGPDQQPLQWLCSMADMTWPKQTRPGESLIALALNHGIGVSSAHRALTDCQLLAELFNRLAPHELITLIKQALRPKAWFKAEVSYENRHLAKNEGFRWDSERRIWVRKIPIEDANHLCFRVIQLCEAT